LFFNARNLNTSNDSARNGRELLLHFENFNTMGQAADAEAIWIEDIISANNISSASPSSDSIDYVREPLQSGYI
jgi:hypothetical protein